MASLPVIDQAGHRWEIDAAVFDSGAGPKSSILLNLITAWHLDSVFRGKSGQDELSGSVRNGVAHDRALLDASGVKGIVNMDQVRRAFVLRTWEELGAPAGGGQHR